MYIQCEAENHRFFEESEHLSTQNYSENFVILLNRTHWVHNSGNTIFCMYTVLDSVRVSFNYELAIQESYQFDHSVYSLY